MTMIVLLILLKGCVVCAYLTAYGHYGSNNLNRNYAVMQNVSWDQAFDQCTQNIKSGRLFNKLSTFSTHLQHDRSVLRQNGWQNIDIWFGIMSSDNSTWLSAEQNECVDDLTGRVKDKLPPLTPGFSQCMLLNMSGLHDTDIYYAASCDELHPFICQSQVSIGSVEVTLYSEMKIKLDYFDIPPKVKTIWSYNLDECQDQMSNHPRAFAGVYYPATGDCELYLHNPPLMYPVRVQMENHTNVMSIVKSKGHEVVAISGNSSDGDILVMNSQKCFNYGLSSQPASTQGNDNVSGDSYTNTTKTTTHQDVSSTSNDDHTLPTTEPISTENTGTVDEILNCVCICESSTARHGNPISLPDLRIDKTTLSSYRRRYMSVRDHRFSATVIGWSGATILICFILAIILPDFVLIAKQIMHRYKNGKHNTSTA